MVKQKNITKKAYREIWRDSIEVLTKFNPHPQTKIRYNKDYNSKFLLVNS